MRTSLSRGHIVYQGSDVAWYLETLAYSDLAGQQSTCIVCVCFVATTFYSQATLTANTVHPQYMGWSTTGCLDTCPRHCLSLVHVWSAMLSSLVLMFKIAVFPWSPMFRVYKLYLVWDIVWALW